MSVVTTVNVQVVPAFLRIQNGHADILYFFYRNSSNLICAIRRIKLDFLQYSSLYTDFMLVSVFFNVQQPRISADNLLLYLGELQIQSRQLRVIPPSSGPVPDILVVRLLFPQIICINSTFSALLPDFVQLFYTGLHISQRVLHVVRTPAFFVNHYLDYWFHFLTHRSAVSSSTARYCNIHRSELYFLPPLLCKSSLFSLRSRYQKYIFALFILPTIEYFVMLLLRHLLNLTSLQQLQYIQMSVDRSLYCYCFV